MAVPVWIVYSEIAPTAASRFPPGAAGAFLELYVPRVSAADARRLALARFTEDGYRVVELEECLPLDAAQWNDENDPDPSVRRAARKVAQEGEIAYGPFRVWGEGESGPA